MTETVPQMTKYDQSQTDFNTPAEYLPGVGPKTAKKLAKLGVGTIGDLIYFFPRKYLDYSQIVKINDLLTNPKSEFLNPSQVPNNKLQIFNDSGVTIKARIVGISNKPTRHRRFTVTEAVVEDGAGTLKVVWFNQPYLSKMLRAGREIILHGRVAFDRFSNGYVMESPDWADKPKIVPIYRETDGVSSYYIAKLVAAIKAEISSIPEFLPSQIIEQNDLLGIDEAIRILHGPANMVELGKARQRMGFDELFLISLRGQMLKQELKHDLAPIVKIDENEVKQFIKNLSFELTGDQMKAVHEILEDLNGRNFEILNPKSETNSKLKLQKVSCLPVKNPKPNSCISPMNRLLNGDVGSGKTIVAAIAAYTVASAGYNVMIMAPTEILAKQHFESFQKLFAAHNIDVGLVTSSSKRQASAKKQKSGGKALIDIEESRPRIFIGTHALLYMEESVHKVGLVVVDEQHRFGVNQRAAIKQLSIANDQFSNNDSFNHCKTEKMDENCKLKIENSQRMVPHFLSMTATPIPRSLQLVLFSELNVSVIEEKPANRKEIKTRVVDEVHRAKAYEFIRAHVKAGKQVFVICPLIEETQNLQSKTQNGDATSHAVNSDGPSNYGAKDSSIPPRDNNLEQGELFDLDRKTVVGEYEKLSKNIFPELRIGMLHGKMKAAEKDAIMADFSSKRLDILVSTSVVEVGVDIPNATVMMIEDAERFGLAQLHQFRGRVGRGEHQSFCFLFTRSENPKAVERLKGMESISDGFKLAELDLKNRGAGDIFGTDQSGFAEVKFANLGDAVLIARASEAAKQMAEDDPTLSKVPVVKEKLASFMSTKHME